MDYRISIIQESENSVYVELLNMATGEILNSVYLEFQSEPITRDEIAKCVDTMIRVYL